MGKGCVHEWYHAMSLAICALFACISCCFCGEPAQSGSFSHSSPCVVRSQHQIENTILTGRMKTMPSSNEVDEMIVDRISVVSVRASESGKPLWNSTLVGSIFLSQHSDQIILLICRHLVV